MRSGWAVFIFMVIVGSIAFLVGHTFSEPKFSRILATPAKDMTIGNAAVLIMLAALLFRL